jgi:hypothetical protein
MAPFGSLVNLQAVADDGMNFVDADRLGRNEEDRTRSRLPVECGPAQCELQMAAETAVLPIPVT